MHYDLSCNGELKKDLKIRHITYADIAEKLHYSTANIKFWFSTPISAERELLVRQAIQRIEEERGIMQCL